MGDLKAIMQSLYNEIGTPGADVDALIDTYFAGDFVEHEALPGMDDTRETPRQMFKMMQAAFPDIRTTVGDMIQEDDKVVARAVFSGTHKGEFMGVPATGNEIDIKVVDICQFREGKMVAHWGLLDAAGVMEQMGVGGPPG